MIQPHAMPSHATALALVIALSLSGACRQPQPQPQRDPPARGCTEIGCTDGLSVALEPSASWPPGQYELELTVDGQSAKCTGQLPLPACDSGPALSCAGAPVSVGESGCAMPPSTHAFSDITLSGTPAALSIVVRHEQRELVRKTFSPTYRRSQPNGPDCPPTCTNARETLRVF